MNWSIPHVYALAGAALFCMGFYNLIAVPHLLRKILALNVTGSGVFLVFIALAYRGPDQHPDPVPHALVLTGIVVAVSTTAVALALSALLHEAAGRMELPSGAGPPT